MEYLTGNLALDGGNSILNKAIEREIRKRPKLWGISIPVKSWSRAYKVRVKVQ